MWFSISQKKQITNSKCENMHFYSANNHSENITHDSTKSQLSHRQTPADTPRKATKLPLLPGLLHRAVQNQQKVSETTLP